MNIEAQRDMDELRGCRQGEPGTPHSRRIEHACPEPGVLLLDSGWPVGRLWHVLAASVAAERLDDAHGCIPKQWSMAHD